MLLASAGFAISLILMALEISYGKTKDLAAREVLIQKITALRDLQTKLAGAADRDLEVFNSYRALLKKKDPDEEELKVALKEATGSPLEVCGLIRTSISLSNACETYCNKRVLSDLKAGSLLLEAIYKGLLLLAEGNVELLAPEEREFYQQWKEKEENKRSEVLNDV